MSTSVDTITIEDELAEALRLTHIVTAYDNPTIWVELGHGPNVSSKDVVDYARRRGVEVIALCGYSFIPEHDPEKYDACGACMEIAAQRMGENGE